MIITHRINLNSPYLYITTPKNAGMNRIAPALIPRLNVNINAATEGISLQTMKYIPSTHKNAMN
jgi:hypothetical protein